MKKTWLAVAFSMFAILVVLILVMWPTTPEKPLSLKELMASGHKIDPRTGAAWTTSDSIQWAFMEEQENKYLDRIKELKLAHWSNKRIARQLVKEFKNARSMTGDIVDDETEFKGDLSTVSLFVVKNNELVIKSMAHSVDSLHAFGKTISDDSLKIPY